MTLRLYYWVPHRELRQLIGEVRLHTRAWLRIVATTKRLPSNFGDQLSPILVRHFSGQPVRWARPSSADMVAVGSLLEHFLDQEGPQVRVWGAGLREPHGPTLTPPSRLSFLAVRGVHTRTRLNLPDHTPLGDPAVLAGEVFPGRRVQRSGVAIVPHFTEFQGDRAADWLNNELIPGQRVVVPNGRPEEVFDAIVRADLVLAGALHGLVLADAVGVPALPVALTEDRMEPWDKLADYESAYDLDPPERLRSKDLLSMDLSSLMAVAEERATRVQARLPEVQQRLALALSSI